MLTATTTTVPFTLHCTTTIAAPHLWRHPVLWRLGVRPQWEAERSQRGVADVKRRRIEGAFEEDVRRLLLAAGGDFDRCHSKVEPHDGCCVVPSVQVLLCKLAGRRLCSQCLPLHTQLRVLLCSISMQARMPTQAARTGPRTHSCRCALAREADRPLQARMQGARDANSRVRS